MKTVNVHDAKTNFSKLLGQVEENGDRVVICRNGKPIADLVPHKRKIRMTPHPVMSKIQINYDPVEDLTEDEWPKSAR